MDMLYIVTYIGPAWNIFEIPLYGENIDPIYDHSQGKYTLFKFK